MELKRAMKASEITGETPKPQPQTQQTQPQNELRSPRALHYALKEVELNQEIFERFRKETEKFKEDTERFFDWIEDRIQEILDQEEPEASRATDIIGQEIQELKARVYRLEKITGLARQETRQSPRQNPSSHFSPRG